MPHRHCQQKSHESAFVAFSYCLPEAVDADGDPGAACRRSLEFVFANVAPSQLTGLRQLPAMLRRPAMRLLPATLLQPAMLLLPGMPALPLREPPKQQQPVPKQQQRR